MTLHWGGEPDALYWDGEVSEVYLGADLVWSASTYPLTVSWGPESLGQQYTTQGSHVIEEPGTYTLTHAVTAGVVGSVRARITGAWGEAVGDDAYQSETSTASTSQSLSPGHVVEFSALTPAGLADRATGTWSIVKN